MTSRLKEFEGNRIEAGYEDPSPSRGYRRDPREAERGVLEMGVSERVRRRRRRLSERNVRGET